MKFKKFIIERFRAIERAEISLSNSLIPLIGINESGKTSILHAILSFHREKDQYKEGQHLMYENKYETGKTRMPCYIKAEVIIETMDEVNGISDRPQFGGEPKNILIGCMEKQTPVTVVRDLQTKRYSVENPVFAPDLREKLAESIYEYLPHILYFDSFSVSPDDSIYFPGGYNFDKRRDPSQFAEWRELLSEIFYQASGEEYSLKDFIQIPEKDDKRDNIIRRVNYRLNQDIIKEWEELRREGIAASDEDYGNLELEIKYYNNSDNNKMHEFQFKMLDSTKDPAGHGFSISKRSTGFNWFFNFIVKLKYNPDYRQKPSGAIYLLDEPGSNLHSSAQEGLLKQLQKLSERNQIIFGTHSQYLLDPEIIPINEAKIVYKKNGKIAIKNFGEAGVELDQGALTPLFHALHLNIGSHNFIDKKAIITEGITDFYFFKMLTTYSAEFQDKNFSIIPGAGAKQLKNLISFAIAWANKKYLVLLDTDDEGNEAFNLYKKFFGEEEAKRIFQYNTSIPKAEFKLEDFFEEADKQRLLQITKVEDIKSAIITLYFMPEHDQEEFIKNLDTETVSRLELVINRINDLAQ